MAIWGLNGVVLALDLGLKFRRMQESDVHAGVVVLERGYCVNGFLTMLICSVR